MGLLGWFFVILGLVWVLLGVVALSPFFALVAGLKFIMAFISVTWRVQHGKHL